MNNTAQAERRKRTRELNAPIDACLLTTQAHPPPKGLVTPILSNKLTRLMCRSKRHRIRPLSPNGGEASMPALRNE